MERALNNSPAGRRITMNYNREYRSSIFAMLFNDKKELLSLYNAVNGTAYTDEEEITVNTLENEGVPVYTR